MSHHERPRHVPVSTYRLQIHGGFPLTAARDVTGYLARLGVGTVYTSPYFAAAPGSTHGYDVCNHNEINPEAGGAPAHAEFVAAVAAHGLTHIVDFVPNHMGIGTGANAWWMEVLENGPSSPSAKFFDVDWTPVKAELHAKLLLPILGDQYGQVLERGEMQLEFRDGVLVLRYFDHELPINPRQAPRVYRTAIGRVYEALGGDHPQLHEFLSIIASLENMPPYTESEPARMAERQREKEVARGRLSRLASECQPIREAIEEAVARTNGDPGRPESFDALHELLEAQAYRLSYWRTASHEINYRRFFDINTLAGLRIEDPEVFEETHRLIEEMLREERIQGIRLDHPDGLFDPARYFLMLQDLAARAWNTRREADREGRPDRPLYAVAEKILSGGERLPPGWAVHGTTGYNYLNDLNGIYIDQRQARVLRRAYTKLTGSAEPFEEVLYRSKRLIIETAMVSELTVLTHILDRIAESNRKSRDFTRDSVRAVLVEVVACFPVYRTYVDERGWTPEDRKVVERAIARARRRNPAMESSMFDFFLEVMLPRDVEATPIANDRRDGYPPATPDEARERLRFAMKLQQYTGPVQAKGLEDTAFYRYNVLLSVNEVGGDPARFGRTVEEFHAVNGHRIRAWPYELLTTATHDTKLGEDVRGRVNAISEIPTEWGREVSRWMRTNRTARGMSDNEPAPDRNDEYRLYQALVGAWPLELGSGAEGEPNVTEAPAPFVERLQAYMLKAVREAKVHTSWLTPNAEYEDALKRFIEQVLTGAGGARFIPAMLPLQRRIATLGMLNSLSQTVMKLGSPGVPDFYQGTELWDLSLVDPDNRRPVDFDLRERLLTEVDDLLATPHGERVERLAGLVTSWRDGRIKLLISAAGLRVRREHPELFLSGQYLPLGTEVTVPGGAVAFARLHEGHAVLFVGSRLCAPLLDAGHTVPLGGEHWKTSRVLLPPELAERTFVHAITGAEIEPTAAGGHAWIFLGQVFEHVPAGILRAV
ncbi:MAG: malto-oligosyltrehalose synthase [Acidobacteria bacterium]|nr:malto-oligosyltrehalose synthase [Acidobacteriota bacterium]